MTLTAAEGVKSADRAMAILEVFRSQRQPLAAREIAEALGMPRSSTNVLLRSLIQGGYLRYDEARALYFPTLRVFHLGSWLAEGWLDEPELNALMRRLAEATGETVAVWGRIGLELIAMQIIDSAQPIRLYVNAGARAPLFGSIVGAAMLMALPDAEVEALAERHAARVGASPEWRSALTEEIAQNRARGHALGYDRWLADAGAVAMPHLGIGDEPLVIGIGGPTLRMRRKEALIVAALHDVKTGR